jgi:hypothetical protein
MLRFLHFRVQGERAAPSINRAPALPIPQANVLLSILDGMNRVEPKSVEMKLLNPVNGVLNGEFPNDRRSLRVVIHRGPQGV